GAARGGRAGVRGDRRDARDPGRDGALAPGARSQPHPRSHETLRHEAMGKRLDPLTEETMNLYLDRRLSGAARAEFERRSEADAQTLDALRSLGYIASDRAAAGRKDEAKAPRRKVAAETGMQQASGGAAEGLAGGTAIETEAKQNAVAGAAPAPAAEKTAPE